MELKWELRYPDGLYADTGILFYTIVVNDKNEATLTVFDGYKDRVLADTVGKCIPFMPVEYCKCYAQNHWQSQFN